MKIRDLIQQEIDIDVYDEVCEDIGIAFCGPLKLTDLGKKKFNDVLDYDVCIQRGIRFDVAIIKNDCDNWKEILEKAKSFFWAAAGYCADDDYNKWFILD